MFETQNKPIKSDFQHIQQLLLDAEFLRSNVESAIFLSGNIKAKNRLYELEKKLLEISHNVRVLEDRTIKAVKS